MEGDAPDPEQYLYPPSDELDDPLGYALYEDGASFVFHTIYQYAAYLGTAEMPGALWDAGVDYQQRNGQPEPLAEQARELHTRNHRNAVFVLADDWRTSISFERATQRAVELGALDCIARRRAAGLTVVTARKSSGGPAPRRQLASGEGGAAFGAPAPAFGAPAGAPAFGGGAFGAPAPAGGPFGVPALGGGEGGAPAVNHTES